MLHVFSRIIINLLVKNRSVVLPDLGTLRIRTQGPELRDDQTMSVPVRRITFTEDVEEGIVLTEFIAGESGKPESNVLSEYRKWAAHCRKNPFLVEIEGIGLFSRQPDGTYLTEETGRELEAWLNPWETDEVSLSRLPRTEKSDSVSGESTDNKEPDIPKFPETVAERAIPIKPLPSRTAPTPVRSDSEQKPEAGLVEDTERLLPPPHALDRKSVTVETPIHHPETDGTKNPPGKRNRRIAFIATSLMVVLAAWAIWQFLLPDRSTDSPTPSTAATPPTEATLPRTETIPSPEQTLSATEPAEPATNEIAEGDTSGADYSHDVYHLVGGVFSTPENAQRFISQNNEYAADAQVIPMANGKFMVSLGYTETKADADRKMAALKHDFPEIWISKRPR